MHDEIEVKILEISIAKTLATLRKLHAKEIKNVFQKNFLYGNEFVKKKKIVVRLRVEGKRCWLTVKSPSKIVHNHKIRKEYEIEIPSYKFGHAMLSVQGYKIMGLNEIKRRYFSLYGCSVEIVQLPTVPPYLELEGTEKSILKATHALGYTTNDHFGHSVMKKYHVKTKFLRF